MFHTYVFKIDHITHSKPYPAGTSWDEVRSEWASPHYTFEPVRREWEKFAWPGGYPLFLVCDDGETLCVNCGNAHFERTVEPGDQFYVAFPDINYEDPSLYCCHCGTRIPSAYGDDDEAEDA